MAAQQFVAPVGKDDDAAIRAIVEWADVARQVLMAPTGQEAISALSSYFLKVTKLGRQRLGVVFQQHIGPKSMKHFESTYDRITRESKAEGMATVLLRLMRKRFGKQPASVEQRIHKATTEDLERWTDGVLEAESALDLLDG